MALNKEDFIYYQVWSWVVFNVLAIAVFNPLEQEIGYFITLCVTSLCVALVHYEWFLFKSRK